MRAVSGRCGKHRCVKILSNTNNCAMKGGKRLPPPVKVVSAAKPMMNIALDAMGGDHAPEAIVAGAPRATLHEGFGDDHRRVLAELEVAAFLHCLEGRFLNGHGRCGREQGGKGEGSWIFHDCWHMGAE